MSRIWSSTFFVLPLTERALALASNFRLLVELLFQAMRDISKYERQFPTGRRERVVYGARQNESADFYICGGTPDTVSITGWHDYTFVLLSLLVMLKEKVLILNLIGFECYWTGVIDEHCGAITAVSCFISFHRNMGRQKNWYIHACDSTKIKKKISRAALISFLCFSFALI